MSDDNNRLKSMFRRFRSSDKDAGSKKSKKQSAKDLTQRQVRSVSNNRRFPSWKQWKRLPSVLTKTETRMLQAAFTVILLSLFTIGGWYFMTHRVETPTVGGEYTEALIGEPQLINPLYASASDVDADLTALVYSGLMRWDPNEGLVKDLASEIKTSEDGTTYEVTIRDDAQFHNGEPVRPRDVIFTVNAIQNPLYRSNLAANFQNVDVSQVDDTTVAFTLDEPFAPFLETLTVGILPADVWSDIPPRNAMLAALNLEPIGSGPYQFAEFAKNQKGQIQTYTLERNPDFYREPAMIEQLNFKFYTNGNAAVRALENKNVEGVSFVPSDLEQSVKENNAVQILRPKMPRAISLFFNQSISEKLQESAVRQAIVRTIDKQSILNDVLGGHGTTINSPILPDMLGYDAEAGQAGRDLEQARQLLDEAGYTKPEGATYREIPEGEREEETETDESTDEADTEAEEGDAEESGSEDNQETQSEEDDQAEEQEQPYALTFSLTTVQNPEFVAVAERIKQQMKEVGIKVQIRTVPSDTFYNRVLSTHEYELLLTGTLSGADPDPYPFWHSSQTDEGGLNLAQYENRQIDELLEQARSTTDEEKRAELYKEFQEKLIADAPAVFLYQSTYTYALPNKIKNVEIPRITEPSERWSDVNEWYIETRKTLK